MYHLLRNVCYPRENVSLTVLSSLLQRSALSFLRETRSCLLMLDRKVNRLTTEDEWEKLRSIGKSFVETETSDL